MEVSLPHMRARMLLPSLRQAKQVRSSRAKILRALELQPRTMGQETQGMIESVWTLFTSNGSRFMLLSD